MLGDIMICLFILEFRLIHPEGATYQQKTEVACQVTAVRPVEDADSRQQIKVDCSETLDTLRLTDSIFNTAVRWAILGEDCI
jgi:hypothetical protein